MKIRIVGGPPRKTFHAIRQWVDDTPEYRAQLNEIISMYKDSFPNMAIISTPPPGSPWHVAAIDPVPATGKLVVGRFDEDGKWAITGFAVADGPQRANETAERNEWWALLPDWVTAGPQG